MEKKEYHATSAKIDPQLYRLAKFYRIKLSDALQLGLIMLIQDKEKLLGQTKEFLELELKKGNLSGGKNELG